jgi:hypothetical protein
MGGKNAPLMPEESIRSVIKVLAEFDADRHNGTFLDYRGNFLQW